MAKIILKTGREQSVLRRHPWIFSGAIREIEGHPVDGQTVEVFDSRRTWLARGSYSVHSQISVRLLTFDREEPVDETFFFNKVDKAIAYRKALTDLDQVDALRLIYAESDGLPGVIADCYGDYLVCQFSSAGAEKWKEVIVKHLQELWPCCGILERSDTDSRLKEGYPARVITLAGSPPPQYIPIHENGVIYMVDVYNGHKTGFYLDQRMNRRKIMAFSNSKSILNAFSYTGGFGLAAAVAGAGKVVNVDTSEESLQLAKENFKQNGREGSAEFICDDVFRLLRTYRDSRMQFDLIILDPPKFVASANQLGGGARGYKDINLLAFKLIKPGGIIVTFSCSGYVRPELFQKIVSDAAADAGKNIHILDFLYQASDHPVTLSFPEGLYLKGLICKAD